VELYFLPSLFYGIETYSRRNSGGVGMSNLRALDLIGSAPPAWPANVPIVTVAVPSYNQGRFLDETLQSIFAQSVPMEVMLADGGSTDDTQRVIARWRHRLTWWRSAPDQGQAASINEAIERGRAPFVCWMNSDDLFLSEGLAALVQALELNAISAALVFFGSVDDIAGAIGGKAVADRATSGLEGHCWQFDRRCCFLGVFR